MEEVMVCVDTLCRLVQFVPSDTQYRANAFYILREAFGIQSRNVNVEISAVGRYSVFTWSLREQI